MRTCENSKHFALSAFCALALAGCLGINGETDNPKLFVINAMRTDSTGTHRFRDTAAKLHCTKWTGDCSTPIAVSVTIVFDPYASVDAGKTVTPAADAGDAGAGDLSMGQASFAQPCECQDYQLVGSQGLVFRLPAPLSAGAPLSGHIDYLQASGAGFGAVNSVELTRVTRANQVFSLNGTYYTDIAGVFSADFGQTRFSEGFFYSTP